MIGADALVSQADGKERHDRLLTQQEWQSGREATALASFYYP
jgi:hypothetical protein